MLHAKKHSLSAMLESTVSFTPEARCPDSAYAYRFRVICTLRMDVVCTFAESDKIRCVADSNLVIKT